MHRGKVRVNMFSSTRKENTKFETLMSLKIIEMHFLVFQYSNYFLIVLKHDKWPSTTL